MIYPKEPEQKEIDEFSRLTSHEKVVWSVALLETVFLIFLVSAVRPTSHRQSTCWRSMG